MLSPSQGAVAKKAKKKKKHKHAAQTTKNRQPQKSKKNTSIHNVQIPIINSPTSTNIHRKI